MAKKSAGKKKSPVKKNPAVPFFWNSLLVMAYGVLLLLLIVNIYASTQMPDIFYGLNNKDPQAVVDFFKRVSKAPQFTQLFPEIKHTLLKHRKDIYKESDERREQIASLEKILEINPQSRDVLYSLYLLHESNGNTATALHYWEQAQLIDPQVKKIP